MGNECIECGERVGLAARGRSRSYCSNACRQRAYRARQRRPRAIPAEMVAADRWTACEGKRPTMASGSPASSTDPRTWGPLAAVQGGPHGFMLGGGFACIDLDGCITTAGRLSSWAQQIIDAVPGAFVERSVSGRGLHIFGLLPEAPGRNLGAVEVYSRSRFIRTTGDVHRPGDLVDLAPAVRKISQLQEAGGLPEKNLKN